jgi:hypothetical protein
LGSSRAVVSWTAEQGFSDPGAALRAALTERSGKPRDVSDRKLLEIVALFPGVYYAESNARLLHSFRCAIGGGKDIMVDAETIGIAPWRLRGAGRPKPMFIPAVSCLESRDLPGGLVAVADQPAEDSNLTAINQLLTLEAHLGNKLGTLHAQTTADGTTHYELDYSKKLTQKSIANVLRLQAQINQIAGGIDATAGADPEVADQLGHLRVLSYLVTSFAAKASAHLRKST